MADVLSSTGPSFFMGLVFVLQGLVNSRLAGGHCHDIGLSFGLFFFLVGGGGALASGPTLLGCCSSVINPT